MTLKLFTPDGEFIAYNQLKGKSNRQLSVIFLGGFNSNKEATKALFLEQFCHEQGLHFIRFDYFGHGSSSGQFSDGTIEKWLNNVLLIIDQLTEQKLLLIGSSMGGWLMSLVAELRPERIAGLIGIAAAPDFVEELIWEKLADKDKQIMQQRGWINVNSTECDDGYPISFNLVSNARNYLILDKKITLNAPIRLLHGTADLTVPYHYALRLEQVFTSHDFSIKLIKNGDHRLATHEHLLKLKHTIFEIMDHL